MALGFRTADATGTLSDEHTVRVSPADISLFLRTIDVLSIFSSGLVAFWIASFVRGEIFQQKLTLLLGPMLVGSVVAAFVLHHLHCYWRTNYLSRHQSASRLAIGWALSFAVIIILAYLIKISADYSRAWALIWFVCGLLALNASRLAVWPIVRRMADEGVIADRVWLIGNPERMKLLQEQLADEEDLLNRIEGNVYLPSSVADDGESTGLDEQLYLLSDRVKAGNLDTVIFVVGPDDLDVLREAIGIFANTSVEVLVICDPLECPLPVPVKSYRFIGGVPMLVLIERPISGWSAIAKRMEDVVVAGCGVVFTLPLMAVIALAVRLSGPGPIIFRQPRMGVDGRLFEVFKFRTMHHRSTDKNAEKLTTKGDKRVTAVGRFLRRTSLDELPQLFNVLKGDMSIVGPRPHALSAKAGGKLYQEVYEAYMARHRVKPGITGWAQVNGWRGETETADQLIHRVEHDMAYIERWSLLFDIYIILITPISLARYRDVY